jgi:protein-tyrosine phosphatase
VKISEIAHQIDSHVEVVNRMGFNHNVVFVHCAMGVSRSATCVIMFIMKKFKVRFE